MGPSLLLHEDFTGSPCRESGVVSLESELTDPNPRGYLRGRHDCGQDDLIFHDGRDNPRIFVPS
jgi:hypothetical protein